MLPEHRQKGYGTLPSGAWDNVGTGIFTKNGTDITVRVSSTASADASCGKTARKKCLECASVDPYCPKSGSEYERPHKVHFQGHCGSIERRNGFEQASELGLVVEAQRVEQLADILLRAREEAWEDLALVPNPAQWRVDELRGEGWKHVEVRPIDEGVGLRSLAKGMPPGLKRLWLMGHDITAEGVPEFAQLLGSIPALTQLSLTNTRIGDGGAAALANALSTHTGLTDLAVMASGLGDDAARALAKALMRMPGLTRLSLNNNSIGNEGAKALAEVLSTLPSMTHLDLSLNCIADIGTRALAEVLRSIPQLTLLDLSGNNVLDEGAERLADALPGVPGLISLYLFNNAIGPQGAIALASVLPSIPRLTALAVSSNRLGAEGAKALGRALRGVPRLEHLDLRANNIGAEGIGALALESTPQLMSLDAAENRIGDDGAKRLSKALHCIPRLTRLELGWNNIGLKGINALAGFLHHVPCLAHLGLGGNGIGPGGSKGLARAMGNTPCLERLELTGSGIGAEGTAGEEMFFRAVEHHPRLKHLGLDSRAFGIEWTVCALTPQEIARRWLYQGGPPLLEAKAMLLGVGRVGKTQIMHRLRRAFDVDPAIRNTTAPLIKDDLETVAWDSATLNIGVPFARGGEPLKEHTCRVRVFDFGGQPEISQAHRFLLDRERSVYILVFDALRDAASNRVEYFLRMARAYGEGSPIVVVFTHCQSSGTRKLHRTEVVKVASEVGLTAIELDRTGIQAKKTRAKDAVPRVTINVPALVGVDPRSSPPSTTAEDDVGPWRGFPRAPVLIVDNFDNSIADDEDAGACRLYNCVRWALTELKGMWSVGYGPALRRVKDRAETLSVQDGWTWMSCEDFQRHIFHPAVEGSEDNAISVDAQDARLMMALLRALGVCLYLDDRRDVAAENLKGIKNVVFNPDWMRDPVYSVLRAKDRVDELKPDHGVLTIKQIRALLREAGITDEAAMDRIVWLMEACELAFSIDAQRLWLVPDCLEEAANLAAVEADPLWADTGCTEWTFAPLLPDDVFLRFLGRRCHHVVPHVDRPHFRRNYATFVAGEGVTVLVFCDTNKRIIGARVAVSRSRSAEEAQRIEHEQCARIDQELKVLFRPWRRRSEGDDDEAHLDIHGSDAQWRRHVTRRYVPGHPSRPAGILAEVFGQACIAIDSSNARTNEDKSSAKRRLGQTLRCAEGWYSGVTFVSAELGHFVVVEVLYEVLFGHTRAVSVASGKDAVRSRCAAVAEVLGMTAHHPHLDTERLATIAESLTSLGLELSSLLGRYGRCHNPRETMRRGCSRVWQKINAGSPAVTKLAPDRIDDLPLHISAIERAASSRRRD